MAFTSSSFLKSALPPWRPSAARRIETVQSNRAKIEALMPHKFEPAPAAETLVAAADIDALLR